ncbi:MAG: efflux RND transporter permease subunit [Candidatus Brocadiaceae bacterium]|nr:efflux RND transporter permease subunit [Candidatus Brocadiaceae bacterium]
MNLPEVSVRNPVTTLMVFLGVILVGAFCLLQMPLDLFPEMEIPILTIMTPYEGAGPEEIEEKITRPLERVLSTVEDLKNSFSTSKEGSSQISLEFDWGTDLEARANDVRDAVDMTLRLMPEEAERPRIFKLDMNQFPVMVYGVYADESYAELEDILENEVANPLEGAPGVAAVTVITPLQRQVNVDLDRELLAAHRLTPSDVAGALARENYQAAAGSIKMGDTDYLPRVPGEFETVEPMNEIVVRARDGAIVRLKDVGRATFGFRDMDLDVRINGLPGGIFFVQKQSGANTVSTAREVRRRLDAILAGGRLPADVTVVNVMDGSDDIQRMVDDLVATLLIGGALAMVVVLVFLRQVRGTLIIGLAIPFSLIAAGVVMYMLDYSINMLTLFALIVAIGMVVDNAIVVLENIASHREQGESAGEGAIFGATEVGMAVVASTLTTLCIFFPLLFVQGIARIVFAPFAVVAAAVLLASLFTALTMTPMMASRLLTRGYGDGRRESWFFRMSEAGFDGLANAYSSVLGWSLRHRGIVILAVLALLMSSLALVPAIGFELMPEEDRAMIQGSIKLPVGTRVERTAEALEAVYAEILEEIPEEHMLAIFTRCGTSAEGSPMSGDAGSHVGSFGMRLVPREDRGWHVAQVGDALRKRIQRLAPQYGIVDYRIDMQDAMSGLASGGGRALAVEIRGDDLEAVDRFAAWLLPRMAAVPGAMDVGVSREDPTPEAWVRVDRDKASSLGLNVSDVADAVRIAVYGRTASYYRVGGDEYDIFVRLQESDRDRLDGLGHLAVRLPSGELVRIENVAEVTRELGPLEIERKNQRRIVRVDANVHGRSLGEVAADVQAIVAEADIPQGLEVSMGGQVQEMRETFFWLTLALVIAVILVYMVMASQFESLMHPFVVMFSIPFAFIGVLWVLFLGGYALSMVVFLGALLLIGVVVNNAIVLVDYINILRARGLDMMEAVQEAGRSRLRPVLMTATTTIVALAPMAFKSGQGSETWNPLGATIMGGLLVSTVVTLVLVPTIYSIFESRARPANHR